MLRAHPVTLAANLCVCVCVCIGTAVTRALEVEGLLRRSAKMQRSLCSNVSSGDVTETVMPPHSPLQRTLHMPILRHFLHFRPADLLLYETLVTLGGPCTRKWVLIRSLLSLRVVFQGQGARTLLFPLYAKDLSYSYYE